MAYHSLHLLVIMLVCSYLISTNAIPMSRLTNLQNKSGEVVITKSMNQNQMPKEGKMEDDFVEGRMDFETNDYGPTTSNPIHTPRPPRT